MADLVRFEQVKKTCRMGGAEINALQDAAFGVEEGELSDRALCSDRCKIRFVGR